MPALNRRLFLLAPLGIAAAGGAAFWAMLDRMQEGRFDPRGVPSMLVGKPIPEFSLPGLDPHQGFSSTDLGAPPSPVLVNFFASWCIPCVIEAPQLNELQRRGVRIWGIAYKDKQEATASFLRRTGDPYARIAVDAPGRVAIDFGAYGVPETYLVDRSGVVRWRWAGPLTDDILKRELDPLLKKYS
jgi:cytochrome c biogenesis protein CcmG, thiol:disulfide interchange protein DsbE